MDTPKFKPAQLIPNDIEACAYKLAQHVAGVHRETREYSVMTITMEDILLDGEGMGDYEVTVRQINPPSFLELGVEK